MAKIRIDVYITLVLAAAVGWGAGAVADATVLEHQYQQYVEEYATPKPGTVGGQAGEDIPRAQSVEDLLSFPNFTVEVGDMVLSSWQGVRYEAGENTRYVEVMELPSGERVAATINLETVQQVSDGAKPLPHYTSILPVGEVVREPLPSALVESLKTIGGVDRSDFSIIWA